MGESFRINPEFRILRLTFHLHVFAIITTSEQLISKYSNRKNDEALNWYLAFKNMSGEAQTQWPSGKV